MGELECDCAHGFLSLALRSSPLHLAVATGKEFMVEETCACHRLRAASVVVIAWDLNRWGRGGEGGQAWARSWSSLAT